MNRATLIGRVGRDPESRSMQNGDRVVNFSLATSERWRDKQTGERKEKTEWHNITCWNEGLGKVIEQYVRKGSQVCVEGQIQTRKWQDKDGNDRWSTEIVIPRFGGTLELLGDKRDGDGEDRGGSREQRQDSGSQGGGSSFGRAQSLREQLDDDIPF